MQTSEGGLLPNTIYKHYLKMDRSKQKRETEILENRLKVFHAYVFLGLQILPPKTYYYDTLNLAPNCTHTQQEGHQKRASPKATSSPSPRACTTQMLSPEDGIQMSQPSQQAEPSPGWQPPSFPALSSTPPRPQHSAPRRLLFPPSPPPTCPIRSLFTGHSASLLPRSALPRMTDPHLSEYRIPAWPPRFGPSSTPSIVKAFVL